MSGKLPDLSELEQNFLKSINQAQSADELDLVRKQALGRSGAFNSLLKEMSKLPPDQKKNRGREINELKQRIESALSAKQSECEHHEFAQSLTEKFDKTLPPAGLRIGQIHPLTQVMREITETFLRMGFDVAEGPEVESDENNFTALNIPADHPARDMHDTFYIGGIRNPQSLLRTHTSPVQIRVMRNQKPPVRIIAPGKVYRHEAVDSTHSSVFHQVEGLAVDKGVSFADLKGTLSMFNRSFFGENVRTRFRPSYFPFVEPGAEVDISCTICARQNRACPVCKGSGWIEMLGAGMVHPNVFKAVGYDPSQVTGFAFGMGVERIAMIRYGISDMRLFYENHLDFLSQFP